MNRSSCLDLREPRANSALGLLLWRMGRTTAVVTVFLPITTLPTHGATTLPTAGTGVTEQVLELAIAPAHPCIVLPLYLRCSKCLLIDDGWHRNRKPFLFRLQAMPRLFVWIIRAGVIFHFPVVQCADICFISQNEKNGRGLPGPLRAFCVRSRVRGDHSG